MRRHHGSGLWFGALCGAVALTRLDQAAARSRRPFRGCLVRRLLKYAFWGLPVTAAVYALAIWVIIKVFAFVPAVAAALGAIFFVAGVWQCLRMLKSAISGRDM